MSKEAERISRLAQSPTFNQMNDVDKMGFLSYAYPELSAEKRYKLMQSATQANSFLGILGNTFLQQGSGGLVDTPESGRTDLGAKTAQTLGSVGASVGQFAAGTLAAGGNPLGGVGLMGLAAAGNKAREQVDSGQAENLLDTDWKRNTLAGVAEAGIGAITAGAGGAAIRGIRGGVMSAGRAGLAQGLEREAIKKSMNAAALKKLGVVGGIEAVTEGVGEVGVELADQAYTGNYNPAALVEAGITGALVGGGMAGVQAGFTQYQQVKARNKQVEAASLQRDLRALNGEPPITQTGENSYTTGITINEYTPEALQQKAEAAFASFEGLTKSQIKQAEKLHDAQYLQAMQAGAFDVDPSTLKPNELLYIQELQAKQHAFKALEEVSNAPAPEAEAKPIDYARRSERLGNVADDADAFKILKNSYDSEYKALLMKDTLSETEAQNLKTLDQLRKDARDLEAQRAQKETPQEAEVPLIDYARRAERLAGASDDLGAFNLLKSGYEKEYKALLIKDNLSETEAQNLKTLEQLRKDARDLEARRAQEETPQLDVEGLKERLTRIMETGSPRLKRANLNTYQNQYNKLLRQETLTEQEAARLDGLEQVLAHVDAIETRQNELKKREAAKRKEIEKQAKQAVPETKAAKAPTAQEVGQALKATIETDGSAASEQLSYEFLAAQGYAPKKRVGLFGIEYTINMGRQYGTIVVPEGETIGKTMARLREKNPGIDPYNVIGGRVAKGGQGDLVLNEQLQIAGDDVALGDMQGVNNFATKQADTQINARDAEENRFAVEREKYQANILKQLDEATTQEELDALTERVYSDESNRFDMGDDFYEQAAEKIAKTANLIGEPPKKTKPKETKPKETKPPKKTKPKETKPKETKPSKAPTSKEDIKQSTKPEKAQDVAQDKADSFEALSGKELLVTPKDASESAAVDDASLAEPKKDDYARAAWKAVTLDANKNVILPDQKPAENYRTLDSVKADGRYDALPDRVKAFASQVEKAAKAGKQIFGQFYDPKGGVKRAGVDSEMYTPLGFELVDSRYYNGEKIPATRKPYTSGKNKGLINVGNGKDKFFVEPGDLETRTELHMKGYNERGEFSARILSRQQGDIAVSTEAGFTGAYENTYLGGTTFDPAQMLTQVILSPVQRASEINRLGGKASLDAAKSESIQRGLDMIGALEEDVKLPMVTRTMEQLRTKHNEIFQAINEGVGC